MPDKNAVLIMENTDTTPRLKIEYIETGSIPEELNGESGFHVYHVRMLTQLMLIQLQKESEDYKLSQKEIENISIASSLHDIGKSQIPRKILDSPGKLSPVEYDIIKKHSAFGEELIKKATGDIDADVIKHAKEIARHHHERYDGTGYPDSLSLDDIPISAQVVSLADAFDALTSERSYKAAFAQDVAIEMIANGMCGVFNPVLIDCLLKVVNNRLLTEIREALKKGRNVVEGQDVYVPKNVLFTGNTAYIDEEFIENTFPESLITIVGETTLKKNNRLRIYSSKKPPIKDIFETYEFDTIIYFANELTYGNGKRSDAEELRLILEYTRTNQNNSRVLYFSSPDAAYKGKSGKGLLSLSKEQLCEYYEKELGLDIKIVRIPYLYSGTYKNDFLYKLFDKIRLGKTLTFKEAPSTRAYFISMIDLAELIVRFSDNWKKGVGMLTVNEEFGIKFGDIAGKIKEIKPEAIIDFTAEEEGRKLDTNNVAIRNEYGWFSRIPFTDDIESEYEKYLEINHIVITRFLDKVKKWMEEHPLATKLIELFSLFILTEILLWTTKSALFFQIVDFRMAFIVIMACVHGLGFGLAAAGLSSFSWLIAKMISGTKWITIFYETTNWLSCIYFFLVGAICGYMKIVKDNRINDLQDQNKLLEEKLMFTRELYNDTFREKRDLKKQIIGSKDSFGKIFDITRSLDTVEPRRLYLKIMDTFEEILENKSISVYSVGENSNFARLEVASRDILDEAARSISLDGYTDVINKLKENEIWKNTQFTQGLPMYASGVFRNDKLELLIFIWHTKHEQRSLYYVNLFRILSELVEIFLLRAYDYSQITYEKQYIEGTRILSSQAFERAYANFKDMAERKVFSYSLIEFDTKGFSLKECDEMLARKIRANDVLGLTEKGKLCLLLSQATENDLGFILPRFEGMEIGVKVIK
ncbi:MAG: HD domain-containing protein [Clostridia bacterium]|nr:HD domain-containing protein [Clostridia bacterium]